MIKIFDIAKIPERNLHVRQMVALEPHMDFGAAIRIVKENMARQLATTILKSEHFFWERNATVGQFNALEYGADCIILTREEYAEMQHEAFKQGIAHATGFMPARFEL